MIDIEEIYKNFPNEAYWKLLIDLEYWPKGPDVFDKDASPNYLQNITKAFLFMLLTINDPLNLDFIIGLRDLAFNIKKNSEMGFSDHGVSGIEEEFVSEAGLAQLIDRIRAKKVNLSIHPVFKSKDSFDRTNIFDVINSQKTSLELAKEINANLKQKKWFIFHLARLNNIQLGVEDVSALIRKYNENISKAESEDEKLYLIAEFIQNIHQYHPFSDGNGRTFLFLLLNKLLIMNKLSPTILAIPGRFSGFSVEQLVKEIVDGREVFNDVCNQKLEKKERFIAYLASILNTPDLKNGIENITTSFLELAEININLLYKLSETNLTLRDNINKNITHLYEKIIPKKYNPETIDMVLKMTPPKDYKLLMQAIDGAAYFGNYYLTQKLIAYSHDIKLDTKIRNFKTLFNLSFGSLNEKINELFNSFNLTSVEVTNFLIFDKFALGKDTHHTLHNFLLAKRFTQLQDLLERIEPDHFKDFFNQNLKGMNALQRIALYGNDQLLTYCINRLGVSQSLNLLKQPFVEEELNQIDNKLKVGYDPIKIINWYQNLLPTYNLNSNVDPKSNQNIKPGQDLKKNSIKQKK